ncbi:AbiH family protein [Algoriphagus ratkowskyi]|nr:AbiH family protein [Algoriphagus ratkowskyi]
MRAQRAREIKYKEVNRLILIGNGFDLAHGLKTSFRDFIEDYFTKILENIKLNFYHKDLLLSIRAEVSFRHLDKIFTPSQAFLELRSLMDNPNLKIEKESKLLKTIYNEIEVKTWVDIEVIFFKLLKDSPEKQDKIKELNLEMDFLKRLLKEYLEKEFKASKLKSISRIETQFKQKFMKSEAQPKTLIDDKDISSICVLNFNYTKTPELYLKELSIGNSHIQIHGSLEGDDINSQGLVFGFGDELDEEYLKFENLENDDLFEHIKSFKYLQFQNYRNLLDFVESKPFQVHIYGHSLGLSDRTLLNTIFENENCISIKLFYHKWDNGNDFEKKTYAISRHFKSKASLRAKVVNKEFSEAMGQLSRKV